MIPARSLHPVRSVGLFALLCALTVALSGCGGPPQPSVDRAALIVLYNATDGSNWANNSNWLSEAPIGEWSGVTTDSNGRVTSLHLGGNQLSGEIPAELGNLVNLTRLDFSGNHLTGEIPAELGNLANLSELHLGGNQLTGCVPAIWRYAVDSVSPSVGLPFCSEASTMPPSTDRSTLITLYNATGGPGWQDSSNWLSEAPVGHWKGVTVDSNGRVIKLDLSRNHLTGEMPSELGNLVDLRDLYLYDNQLTGEIPSELGSLTNLTRLYLNGNQLMGEIPAELGSLPNLKVLRLSGNQLTGCIPAVWQYVADSDFPSVGLPFCNEASTMAQSADRAALVTLYDATGGPD